MYYNEISTTANDIMSKDAMLYLVVPANNANTDTMFTFHQYGIPNRQSQNSDYSNFNGPQTLLNLETDGYGQSLQAILLDKGKLARESIYPK